MARDDRSTSRRAVSRDRVRGRAEEEKDNGGSSCIKLPDGVKFHEVKEGTQKLNIVPYEVQSYNHLDEVEKGELWYRKKYHVHRGVGVENKTVVCLTTFGEACPICEYIASAKKSGTGNEQELKDWKKKERALYNVDNGKTIDLFDMSTFCFEQKLQEEIREGREEYADFPNLEGGFTLRVRFKEEVMGKNKFLEAGRIDFDPREDYPDTILDEAVDLDACLVKLSYEVLEKMFYGTGTGTEGGRHEDGAEGCGGRGSDREDRGGRESSRGGRSGGEDTGRGRGEKEESGGRSTGRGERGQEASGSERGGRPAAGADDTRGGGRERSSRGAAAEPEKVAEDTGRGGRGGRGSREEAPADPAPAERSGRGSRGAAQEPEKAVAKSDNKCPGGGKYGEDCDKLDHCATCPAETWEPCRDDTDAFLAANQPAGRGRK